VPSYLGEFEQLVLLALLRLGRHGYGVTVRTELLDHAGRDVSLGTHYKTHYRLEAKGLIAAHVGEPTPARGGRRKKHYVVNARGRTALQRSLAALRGMSRGLDPALGAP
jgi:PadR family transcriptional regulator PadR